ncbi:MAG: DUF3142 domain-containing protein, partial [Tepidisphaerales bacterium]
SARGRGAMRQEAYLWQRAWTDPVRESLNEANGVFPAVCVLAAEIGWDRGQPKVARAGVDYAAIRRAGMGIGVALRVRVYSGPFEAETPGTRCVIETAESIVREAAAAEIRLTELQIDFDCPSSKLQGYRLWLEAIRRRISPVPVTITVLPTWLGSPAFPALARASDGFVLQVHSLARPAGVDAELSLCEARSACQAVETAGRMGVPFRVALPTYAYLVAFDAGGRFIGLSAEGPAGSWPPDARTRRVGADAATMAGLVQDWLADRPINLKGIIWYRLPVSSDTMNWRWATLKSVMAGRAPRPELRVRLEKEEPGLYGVELVNAGDEDAPLRAEARLRWDDAELVAADGLEGFETVRADHGIAFRPDRAAPLQYLAPGEHRAIGWLRLNRDKEVQAYVSDATDANDK